MNKKRILFVCFTNANRSQIAEAFARLHSGAEVDCYSAGIRTAGQIDERAIAVMGERGCDLTTHLPKTISEVPQVEYDAVVTMGCEGDCPVIPAKRRLSWELPRATNAEEFQSMCNAIEKNVKDLLAEL